LRKPLPSDTFGGSIGRDDMTKQEAWEIIDNAGGPSAVALKLKVSEAAVRGWIARGEIPHRYLLALGVK